MYNGLYETIFMTMIYISLPAAFAILLAYNLCGQKINENHIFLANGTAFDDLGKFIKSANLHKCWLLLSPSNRH